MVGRLLYVSGEIVYAEYLYDTKNGNSLSATTRARCMVVSGTPSLEQPLHKQREPEDTARTEDDGWPFSTPDEGSTQTPDGFNANREARPGSSVPVRVDGGAFIVRGSINNQLSVDFVLDSGATEVSIPADVVKTLARTGTITSSDFLDAAKFQLADGSVVPQLRFRIRSLSVGGRVAEDVAATVGDINSTPLLGQSFLQRFRSWSIDNQLGVLNLE